MGRHRKTDRHLPACMYQRRGAYYLVTGGKWTPLGRDYGHALIKYADQFGTERRVETIREAIAHYLESSTNRLATTTLENYRRSATNLIPIFGDMPLQLN